MATVLVTGGAGYIGSHVCKALHAEGFKPVTYDNLVAGNRFAVKWGPFEYGDIRDRTLLDRVLFSYRPIAIMHFAAHAYVGESIVDPGKYYSNNVGGTFTLMQACADHGIARFVFSSSCTVYGNPEKIPIDEANPINPINPYGRSKWISEEILLDFERAHDIKFMALRYFNAAGADRSLETGEWHDPETRVIPVAIDVALKRLEHFPIFGTDYPTPDGTCIRDYIHVTDLAAAHVLALTQLIDGSGSTILNLGAGYGVSVRQIIAEVEAVTGNRVQTKVAKRRPGDPAELVADSQLARKTLNWSPTHSTIDEIVKSAFAWRQKMFCTNHP